MLRLILSFLLTELGERGKDFSAKDLVSSVFSAANKKIRRREKSAKTGESIDIDFESESSYQERNIDDEIVQRIGRVATEGASMIAGTTSGHQQSRPDVATSEKSGNWNKAQTGSSGNKMGSPPLSQSQQQETSTGSHGNNTYSNYSNVQSQNPPPQQQQQRTTTSSSHASHNSRLDLYQAKLAFVQGTDSSQQQKDSLSQRRFGDIPRKPSNDSLASESSTKPPHMRPIQGGGGSSGYPGGAANSSTQGGRGGERKHSLDASNVVAKTTPMMQDKFGGRGPPQRSAEVSLTVKY